MEDDARSAASEVEPAAETVTKTDLKPARGRTFLPEVTGVQFSGSRRGYDRAEVDGYVERVSRIVVELEAMRSPDAVIERALADVGEETSAILRRARKAAEEIIADAEGHAGSRAAQAEAQARKLREEAESYAARVRAEADEVLDHARARAQETIEQAGAEATSRRAETDRYEAQVRAHIDQLAQDRHRLIEDLRGLADQFHRTADRALEQMPAAEASNGEIALEEAAAQAPA